METVKSRMKSAIESLSPVEQHKMQDLNRTQQRKRLRIRHGASNRPFARIRSGVRTGTTPHFKMWMADVNLRRALQGTKIGYLADRHNDPSLALSYRLILRHGYLKTVWDLTQASKAQLHDTPGLGPVRIAALKADLAKRQVLVNW